MKNELKGIKVIVITNKEELLEVATNPLQLKLRILRPLAQKFIERFTNGNALNDDDVLFDEDVMRMLRISKSTIDRYRVRDFIHAVKFSGRWMYLKPLIFAQLLGIEVVWDDLVP